MPASGPDWTKLLKLLVGAGGIYASFLYYGSLQEDVYYTVSPSGERFKSVWFLQVIETLANVVVAFVGRLALGCASGLPLKLFVLSGGSQLCSKAFSSFALTQGVSYPIVTLAKSGKMVPVMIGSLLVGKASYTVSEYLSVLGIVVGTCMVSFGGKMKKSDETSKLGFLFIVLSLASDGLTGGLQNRLKKDLKKFNPQPYDFMMFTNLFMMIFGTIASVIVAQDFQPGVAFCIAHPAIFHKILKFALCSAIGQSFIFFTISNFDPLVCCTVTTTRKIMSVFLSILTRGHELSTTGWVGISIASCGILMELHKEAFHSKKQKVVKASEPVVSASELIEAVPAAKTNSPRSKNGDGNGAKSRATTPSKKAKPKVETPAITEKKSGNSREGTPSKGSTPKKPRPRAATPTAMEKKTAADRRKSSPAKSPSPTKSRSRASTTSRGSRTPAALENEGSPTPVKRRNNNKTNPTVGITSVRGSRAAAKRTKAE